MPRQPQSIVKTFAGAKAEYAAMRDSRFRRRRPGVTAAGGSADTHYASESQFIQMREYVRAMDRDDFMIGQLVDRAVENQVQGGFALDPQTGDAALDDELKARWNDRAGDARACDLAGELTFVEQERLATRAECVDGDIFGLPIDDGTLQMLEADRCRTPTNSTKNIVHGVELDEFRRRKRYYFTKDEISPFRRVERVGDTNPVAAFDADGNPQVFHLFKPTRVSQTRGVTAFKAVVDLCGMVEDTNFAAIVKQQMAACAVFSWEKTPEYVGGDVVAGERFEAELADFTRMVEEGISPGQMYRPPRGVKLNVHSPNVPGEQYFQHMRLLLTFLSVQLGMPLFLALLDASETNFSGWRGAWDQTKIGFQANQERRKARFYRPYYRWQVRRWLEEDGEFGRGLRAALAKGLDVFAHEWNAPSWPYIQPLHDAQANALRTQTGQVSMRRLHAEIGTDFNTFADESTADNAYWISRAIERTIELKKKYGDDAKDVHWRDVYHRDYYRGGQLIDNIEQPNDGSSTPAIKDGAKVGKKK